MTPPTAAGDPVIVPSAPAVPPGQRTLPHHLGDFTTDRRVLVLMAMAVVIGSAGVASAWVLLRLIALCTNLAYFGHFSFAPTVIGDHPLPWTSVFVPVVGALVIGFMARFGSEKIRGHGIPEAIEAILIGRSRISLKVAVLKPLSSAISIGSGGPFGAEGPIIMTGGAVGSLLAQMVHLTSAERKTLLVAGAAAGMTAVFGTPIAAILLAVELLLFEWKPRSFLPVTVAALVAAIERGAVLAPAPLFPFSGAMPVSIGAALAWIAVGVVAGLASGVLTRMVYAAEDAFLRLPIHWMWWPALGGIVVGLGGLIEPHALGVGYDNIRRLLDGDMVWKAAAMLLVVKSIIWSVSLGSGTSGGVLAPLLIFGGAIGALLGNLLPGAAPGFWALLGMAAMMGGTMRVPLTASMFAVELTGDTHVLLPLFCACASAYAMTVLLLKRSILTEKLARRGRHLTREYHADPFDLMQVADVMVRAVDTLPGTMTIEEAIAHFTAAEPRHKSYPVVDAPGCLVGLVSRGDILGWLGGDLDAATTLAEVLAGREVLTTRADELVGTLADRMAQEDVGRVPVVEAGDKVIGIVARKDLLQVRARHFGEERERAAYFALRLPAGVTRILRPGTGTAPRA